MAGGTGAGSRLKSLGRRARSAEMMTQRSVTGSFRSSGKIQSILTDARNASLSSDRSSESGVSTESVLEVFDHRILFPGDGDDVEPHIVPGHLGASRVVPG